MSALQVYCSSWIGISPEAEHIYCQVDEHSIKSLEERCSYFDGFLPKSFSFRYIPTEEQAFELALKDNYRGGGTKIREDANEYLKNGVTRFWSLHQVCEEVHKKFPNMLLYGFFPGHREFCKVYHRESERKNYKPQDYVVLKY